MSEYHENPHSMNGKRLVLIADDDENNRTLLGAFLEKEYEVLYACNGEEVFDRIKEHSETLSLILMDLIMPCMNGLEILRAIKKDPALSHIPVIVQTIAQTAEAESLKNGAADFISKPYPSQDIILARIRKTLELSEDRITIRQTERENLTGLYHTEFFYRYAEQYDRNHPDTPMDAVALEVRHFRLILERCGKNFGASILRQIGDKVREAVKDAGGMVCHRDENLFLIYSPHRSQTDWKRVLDLACDGLSEVDESLVGVFLCMGLYLQVDKRAGLEKRFRRAKMAADTVRGSAANTVAVYDDALRERELLEEQLIEDFTLSLEQHQFTVLYQPKFDIRPEMPVLVSAEALVRWDHPDFGRISPGTFIPLLEENGLIQDLDLYVWDMAAAQIRDWKNKYGYAVPVSVNVSRADMLSTGFPEVPDLIMKKYQLSPLDLLIEITESAYTSDEEHIASITREVHSHGFAIQMDDFGAGHSSLGMLSRLPADALKLDISFVQNAFDDKQDRRMLSLVLDIAKYLNVPVIAVGVETEEQVRVLRSMGCDIVQGFYFSHPVTAGEFERFLAPPEGEESFMPLSKETASSMNGGLAPEIAKNMALNLTYSRVALALSRDYFEAYYVNIRNSRYWEYSMSGDHHKLALTQKGTDFFEACRRDIRKRVVPEDQNRLLAAFERDTLLRAVEKGGSFSLTYRLLIDQVPTYISLKVLHPEEDPNHIVIGLSNVDAQMRREAQAVTYSRVADALAADYFSIYYVDTQTDHFIEYSATEEYHSLGVEREGENFFALSRKNARKLIYSEDQEFFSTVFTKEKLLAELEKARTFTMNYRLMLNEDQPIWVSLKASRMKEGSNGKYIVIGINNVDAQMQREEELTFFREKATRDALTGVKSKYAYAEAESQWNERIGREEDVRFSMVICDVNNLKKVNDSIGHAEGDRLLKDACHMICVIFAHSPVYRIGGDEFAVIVSGQDYDRRQELMELLEKKNQESLEKGGASVACGMEDYRPHEDLNISSVFQRADVIMYQKKKMMKNV